MTGGEACVCSPGCSLRWCTSAALDVLCWATRGHGRRQPNVIKLQKERVIPERCRNTPTSSSLPSLLSSFSLWNDPAPLHFNRVVRAAGDSKSAGDGLSASTASLLTFSWNCKVFSLKCLCLILVCGSPWVPLHSVRLQKPVIISEWQQEVQVFPDWLNYWSLANVWSWWLPNAQIALF